ncbi:MAG: GGDEF domain-containing protein [Deltaproteobacteria bacterium]|nr:GGDEF domain-containing protein [Deltaproteobacteria bacterium]
MSTDETIVSSLDALEAEGEARPFLTFIKGPRLGQLTPLDKEVMTVGRSPDCDLWIEDSAISRKHFRLLVKGNKVEVEDLGSTNGTYVNGEPVKKVLLADGDKIQISRETLLELTYLDETKSLSEKKLYEMGVMDPVTNVYNKRYFLDRLKEEFSFASRKKGGLLALILFDIDHFKNLNDTYGHLAGDLVLQKMCAEVSRAVRTGDLLARYGGEEFVIIMRETDSARAVETAERVRLLVEKQKIFYEGKSVSVTISCGVAVFEAGMKDYDALISLADKRLYVAKEAGRNRVKGP